MTKTVTRDEVLDFVTYSEKRDELRPHFLEQKDRRRVQLGENLYFLFENHDTTLYQIQEMMRAEKIVKEADILHEMTTYNELLGGEGELGCSLLIGIDDPAERDQKLTRWLGLPKHLYLKLPSGERAYARFDPRQIGDDRLSSVQYLKFVTKGEVPVAIGCDLDELSGETAFSEEQREAFREDLSA